MAGLMPRRKEQVPPDGAPPEEQPMPPEQEMPEEDLAPEEDLDADVDAEDADEDEPADPAEDETMAFVGQAFNLVYSEKALPKIVQQLKAGDDRLGAIAHTTVMVVIRVEDSAEQAERKFDSTVLLNAGAVICADLAELAEKLGITKVSQEQLNATFLRAVDEYRMMRERQGKLDQGAAQQDWESLKQADADGTLKDSMPWLEEFSRLNPPKAPKGEERGEGGEPPADGDPKKARPEKGERRGASPKEEARQFYAKRQSKKKERV